MPRMWRTEETQLLYQTERQADVKSGNVCPLCNTKSIIEFDHWRIIPNRYPYDAIAKQHDMLIPLRHTSGDDLSEDELTELNSLKHTVINDKYKYVMESLPKQKSIPGHWHLHLIDPKVVG